MKSTLQCECCGKLLEADFASNVSCANSECLLWKKCYSYDYISTRKYQRDNNLPIQNKERLAQGWVNEFREDDYEHINSSERDWEFPELQVGVEVQFVNEDKVVETGVITGVIDRHVLLGWRCIPKHYVTVV